MNKILYILLFSFLSVFANAQVTQYLGSPNTTIRVRGKLIVDSSSLTPTDTLSSASIGSKAVKNGISFIKNPTGRWSVDGPTVSVKAFGAYGDGIHDDATAITNAINSGHRNIYMPPGIYKTSSTVAFRTSGVNLIGAGRTSTIIKSDNLIRITVFLSDNVSNISMQDLTLDNEDTIFTSRHGFCLLKFIDSAFTGVLGVSDSNFAFTRLGFTGNKGPTDATLFVVHRQGFGGYVKNVLYNYCVFENMGGAGGGALAEGDSIPWLQNFQYTNCIFRHLGTDPHLPGLGSAGFCASIGGYGTGVKMLNNKCTDIEGIGFEFEKLSNSECAGNTFDSCFRGAFTVPYSFNNEIRSVTKAYNNQAHDNTVVDSIAACPYFIGQNNMRVYNEKINNCHTHLYLLNTDSSEFSNSSFGYSGSGGELIYLDQASSKNRFHHLRLAGSNLGGSMLINIKDTSSNNVFSFIDATNYGSNTRLFVNDTTCSNNMMINYTTDQGSGLFNRGYKLYNNPKYQYVQENDSSMAIMPITFARNTTFQSRIGTVNLTDTLNIDFSATPTGVLNITGQETLNGFLGGTNQVSPIKNQTDRRMLIINHNGDTTYKQGTLVTIGGPLNDTTTTFSDDYEVDNVKSIGKQSIIMHNNTFRQTVLGGSLVDVLMDNMLFSINGSDSLNSITGKVFAISNPTGKLKTAIGFQSYGGSLPNVGDYTQYYATDATTSGKSYNYFSANTYGANKYSFFAPGGSTFYNAGTLVLGIVANTTDSTNRLRVGGKTQLDSAVTIKNLGSAASTDSSLTDSSGLIRHRKRLNGDALHVVTDADYTIVTNDYAVVEDAQTANRTLTLPDPTTNTNRIITIAQTSNNGTFNLNLSRNIYESLSTPTSALINGAKVTIQSDGIRWWVIMSRL